MSYVMLYVPCSNLKEAKSIAHQLVEEKLVACCNILPKMVSVYSWKGNIESEEECLLLAKTSEDNVEEVEKTISGAHSYDCPCIARWTVDGFNKPYEEWLKTVLSPE